jgi:hypothetical protein
VGPGPFDRKIVLDNVKNALLVIWIALIGADRIDLFGGGGAFILTPFLVLSPIVIGVELVRVLYQRKSVPVPMSALEYGWGVTSLLCVLLISVLFSFDIRTSSQRFVLLLVQVYATLAVGVIIANRSNPERILLAGAYTGLMIGFVFNIAQLVGWVSGTWLSGDVSGAVVNLTPHTYGGFVPRLSGQAYDMNRAGLVFLVYLFWVALFGARSRTRTLFLVIGGASLVATLSRSALLAVLVTSAGAALLKGGIRLSRPQLITVSGAGAVLTAWVLGAPNRVAAILTGLEPLGQRFSLEEGSGNTHIALIARGWEGATAGVKNAIVGVGFGNSFLLTQEFFPDSKYGNFHSLYITLLAESGIFALLFGLVLLLYPLLRLSVYAPLVAGIAFFSLFYQAIVDPLFWFVLAVAWMDLGIKYDTPVGSPALGGRVAPPRPRALAG